MAISDIINVNMSIKDRTPRITNFGETLILSKEAEGVFTGRTKQYTVDDYLDDFPLTTKTGLAINKHFAQETHNSTIKVGKCETADANYAASINAIREEDSDWFHLTSIEKDISKIEEISDAASPLDIIYGVSSDQAKIKDQSDTTDIGSKLAAKSYNNTYVVFHDRSGIDKTGVSITVSTTDDVTIATVTSTGHGLSVGDKVTISGAEDVAFNKTILNGEKTILESPDLDTFTYLATGAADGNATAISEEGYSGTIDYFSKYDFLESSWGGLQLSKTIGTSGWSMKTLAGQTPANLTNSERNIIRNKNVNIYVEENGVPITHKGEMVSGRFIMNECVRLELKYRILESIYTFMLQKEKVTYSAGDFNQVYSVIDSVLAVRIARGALTPISDEKDYNIIMPNPSEISATDKAAGNVPDIIVEAKIGSEIVKFNINGYLSL